MFCTNCGKAIPQGAKFCPHCGAAQTTTTAAQQVAQPVSSPVPQASTDTPILKSSPEKPTVRPWIRFWARWIDINLISFLGAFTLAFYYPELASVPSRELILGVVVLFLWVFIESFLLSTAGTTPGKWLLNIHLIPPSGNKPDFSTAFSRSFDVWWRGLGLGLPFVTLFTNAAAYTNLKKNGITTWDRNGGFTVVHERVGLLKGGLAILFISGTLIFFVLFSTNKSALIGSSSLTPSPTEENRRSFSIEEAYSTSLTPSPTVENTGRYRDNNDGTVIDMQTGLQWKRCYEGERFLNGACNGEPFKYTWDDAIAKFGQGSSYAGKNDWRTPSIDELRTLTYCSSGSRDGSGWCNGNYKRPTVNTTAFPSGYVGGAWSASPEAASSGHAWVVNFNGGNGGLYGKDGNFPVRLVRSQ